MVSLAHEESSKLCFAGHPFLHFHSTFSARAATGQIGLLINFAFHPNLETEITFRRETK